ncbi:hypothetical protein BC938DRAFT_478020, partial [Jimgerdemannia flammicorona]
IEALRNQITTREEEIARLGELVETGSGNIGAAPSATAAGPPRVSSSRVEQLEMQIEYYQDQVVELKQKLSQVEKEKTSLEQEHAQDKDSLARQLDEAKDKNGALYQNLEKLEALVNELEDMRSKAGTPGTGGCWAHDG